MGHALAHEAHWTCPRRDVEPELADDLVDSRARLALQWDLQLTLSAGDFRYRVRCLCGFESSRALGLRLVCSNDYTGCKQV